MSEITSHSLHVRRTARYYTIGPIHGFPRELWIVAHGYAQLARRFVKWFSPLDDGTRLIVAPEGLSRFYLDPVAERRAQAEPRVGATWMTREDREAEIADYVSYLEHLASEVRRHLSGAGPRIGDHGLRRLPGAPRVRGSAPSLRRGAANRRPRLFAGHGDGVPVAGVERSES